MASFDSTSIELRRTGTFKGCSTNWATAPRRQGMYFITEETKKPSDSRHPVFFGIGKFRFSSFSLFYFCCVTRKSLKGGKVHFKIFLHLNPKKKSVARFLVSSWTLAIQFQSLRVEVSHRRLASKVQNSSFRTLPWQQSRLARRAAKNVFLVLKQDSDCIGERWLRTTMSFTD